MTEVNTSTPARKVSAIPSWAEGPSSGSSREQSQPQHQDSAKKPAPTYDANLPAFFHVRGADGSTGYSGASPDDTKVMVQADDPAQWAKLWDGDAEGIQMDRVSLFSVTPLQVADEMTKTLLTLDGISKDSEITDGTSCVGGNTVSFARFFSVVNAIEMDSKRCDMLINNVEVCRKHAETLGRPPLGLVRIFCDNCLDIIPRLRQDIVFLDPPWGGKDYKTRTTVPLFLGARSLHEVVLYCLRSVRYVAMKLPKNAELIQIQSDARIEIVLTKEFYSFNLMVTRSPLPPTRLTDGSDYSDPKMENLLINLVKTKPFQDILKTTVLGSGGSSKHQA